MQAQHHKIKKVWDGVGVYKSHVKSEGIKSDAKVGVN